MKKKRALFLRIKPISINQFQVLYPLISAILDSNPFCSTEYMERDAVAQAIHILQTTRDIASDVRLHIDVRKQLTLYLFFFLSTSMFNRIIAKGIIPITVMGFR